MPNIEERQNNQKISYFYICIKLPSSVFLGAWYANTMIRMKVALLTEGLKEQTDEKMQKERPKYAVVQPVITKVLRYLPVSITEQLPKWQG